MRENFAIAGLITLVQVEIFKTIENNYPILNKNCCSFPFQDLILQFDGVYYQKLMEDFAKINQTERKNLIKSYRIYA